MSEPERTWLLLVTVTAGTALLLLGCTRGYAIRGAIIAGSGGGDEVPGDGIASLTHAVVNV